MSDTISTSVSAAAIFSAEESWGRPPKRKDIFEGGGKCEPASWITVGGRVCLGERVVVRGGVLSFQARVTGEETSSSPTSYPVSSLGRPED